MFQRRAGPSRTAKKTIRRRIVSSVILMAIALGALALEAWAMTALAVILGIAMSLEWGRLTAHRPALLAAGLVCIFSAGATLIMLRLEPGAGAILLWLFTIAWAGDTAAYAVGRTLGRHALPPWISPEKTWEGVAGGALAGTLAGAVAGHFAAPFSLSGADLALAGAALAVAGQLGDLVESAAKRRLGVKDMSGLIPSHGGVLDRLDSMLAILIATGGTVLLVRWVG